MIQHLATCGYTARAEARIAAFHIDTRFVQRAIGIDYTLGTASRWISHVSRYTRAHRLIIIALASTICTAGRRKAWIFDNNGICKNNVVKLDFSHNIFRQLRNLLCENFYARTFMRSLKFFQDAKQRVPLSMNLP